MDRLPAYRNGPGPPRAAQVLLERIRSSQSGAGPPRAAQVLPVFGAGPAGFWRRSENNWGTRAAKRHPIAFQWRRTPNKKLTCTAQPWDLRQKYLGPAPPVCYVCVAGKSVQRRDCGGAADPVAGGRRVRCGQICAATGLWWRCRSCRGGVEGAFRANLCSAGTVVALTVLSRRGGGAEGSSEDAFGALPGADSSLRSE